MATECKTKSNDIDSKRSV